MWLHYVLFFAFLTGGILALLQRPDFPLFRLREVSGVVKHVGFYHPPEARRRKRSGGSFRIVFEPGDQDNRFSLGTAGHRELAKTLAIGSEATAWVYGNQVVQIEQANQVIFTSHEASTQRYYELRLCGIVFFLLSLLFGWMGQGARKELTRLHTQ